MANYTIADIKELRTKTGAGMGAVKSALDEADGDQAKALEIIRVKGLKGVANREGRSASDGLVAAKVVENEGGHSGVLVEINSETDFVAKTEQFGTLAARVLDAAIASGATSAEELLEYQVEGESVSDIVDSVAAVLGEKIVLRRVARVNGDVAAAYLHRTGKDLPPQIGAVVASDSAGAELLESVAQHVVAYSPLYLSREDVPADVVENERRIAEDTARNEGKPEVALPKIIEGRLTGFFKENVLLDQAYAKDTKKSVGQVVTEAGATLTGFARFRVGA